MRAIKYDLTNQRFERLIAIKRIRPYVDRGNNKAFWLCQCDCGNTVIASTHALISGETKSCGCLKRERTIARNKEGIKRNTYDLSGEFGIGYTAHGIPFYFDLEDYEKIKDYTWNIIKGYVVTSVDRHTISMHRVIMDAPQELMVDHINHDTKDNRKNNLRLCTAADNAANVQISSANTSGAKGVYKRPSGNYTVYISKNNKRLWLGTYKTLQEAAKVYDEKAVEIYGEFACLNNLTNERIEP